MYFFISGQAILINGDPLGIKKTPKIELLMRNTLNTNEQELILPHQTLLAAFETEKCTSLKKIVYSKGKKRK